jgi:uncharacterized protein YjlB
MMHASNYAIDQTWKERRMNSVSHDSRRVIAHRLAAGGPIPNHPHWPLLYYPSAVGTEAADLAAAFEERFGRNGWPAAWRNGIYPFDHFHCNAHEVLGVYSGEVTVQCGGCEGIVLTAQPGDVIVLPAGTGHKKLSSCGALGIVGAYPEGQHPDLCRPLASSAPQNAAAIARVPLPQQDPVYGAGGPLFTHWQ